MSLEGRIQSFDSFNAQNSECLRCSFTPGHQCDRSCFKISSCPELKCVQRMRVIRCNFRYQMHVHRTFFSPSVQCDFIGSGKICDKNEWSATQRNIFDIDVHYFFFLRFFSSIFQLSLSPRYFLYNEGTYDNEIQWNPSVIRSPATIEYINDRHRRLLSYQARKKKKLKISR